MEKTIYKYRVLSTDNKDYPFNVQEWISINDEPFCYTGNGKFFKTHKEANDYAVQCLTKKVIPTYKKNKND